MWKLFEPPRHKEKISDKKIDGEYKKMRLQLFIGIFLGYAGYYFVRNNFALAEPHLIRQGFSHAEVGIALSAVGIAYGLSKFFMGNISDRANARIFLPFGLLLSGLVMLFMGFVPWAMSSVTVMFILLFINGWLQGMGWPPCGRVMVHWWTKKERGRIVAVWNCAHNVGGAVPSLLFILGMWWLKDWRSAIYLPAFAAIVLSVIAFILVRDTPQSCGLPSVEEWKNEYPEDYDAKRDEEEFSARDIFVTYVLKNKALWLIAFANIFVYLMRYGILNWSPAYLQEVKHFTVTQSSLAYAYFEYAGIPGTIICGWVSDKIFKTNRGAAGVVFMILVLICTIIYWINPPGHYGIDVACITAEGFLIYGPVMLIGLHALELVPKKAAGTAAGFTGLFGYLGGSTAANAIVGIMVDHFGWNGGFLTMIIGCIIAIILLAWTMLIEKKHHLEIQKKETELLAPRGI
jgi:OPA family glycerol-3-phosphate transporter-like MFS transporter